MSRTAIFNKVLNQRPPRSKFDLSHDRKMTIPFGALVPTMVSEVLPGDSFDVDQHILARFNAPLAPFMHRVNVWTHFFYVPYRILSLQYERFMSYQGNRPNFSQTASVAPYFTLNNAQQAIVNGGGQNALKDGSLLDYLGFPTAPNDTTPVALAASWYDDLRFNAFLPLAYQRIWNDFYREQNVTQPLFGDGTAPDTGNFFENRNNFDTGTIRDPEGTSVALTSTYIVQLLTLRWRCWEKDYLTSARPYANQGLFDPRVGITVPAGALGNTTAVGTATPGSQVTFGKTGGIQYPGTANNPSDLGGFTVTALRIAAALKRYLENGVKGGTRYVEQLWTRWMVKADDSRMQIAEYLAGGVQPMVISEVVTTAPATPTQTGVPAGYLAGHGIAYGKSNRFRKYFKEHGVVMAITSVLPRTAYLYSMPRAFMRIEPLDYAVPEFANVGEQPVLGAEVMFKLNVSAASASAPNYTASAPTQTYMGVVDRFSMGVQAATAYKGFDLQNDNPEVSANGGTSWGFQSRYGEYKYQPDTVHGLFRNNQSFWHFGRMLSPGITLSNSFVQSNPRMDGFAVLPTNGGAALNYNQHPIMLNVMNNVSVVRSLPYYDTPSVW